MFKRKISKLGIGILLIVFVFVGCSNSLCDSDKQLPNLKDENLVVYVAFNEDEAKVLLEGFKEKTGCNYSFLRFPTEEGAEKIIKEGNLEKADIFLGGTADAVESLKMNNCLDKYTLKDCDRIPMEYRDSEGYWIGLYVEALSIGINEERWNKEFKDVKKPTTIEDLVNPRFKGEIVLPDPRTSGTGYTFLSYLVQTMGKEKALDFFKKLKSNVGQFTDSGFTPAKKVGVGEYLLTVNFTNQQLIVKNSGFKIESIVPQSTGWTICPVAKIKNGANDKAAKAFINYCTTKEAGNALKDFSMAVSTINGVNNPDIKKDFDSYKISNEYYFDKAAKDKKELLEDLKEIM
ncbi:ABC transporter substrate-binding protein [Clostridium uliginosum]|uniref:Iron(III) transport system substrate-binding protein n=1 Tax=Clostridium uliginosum TaxID=119641 RepID=A0A1I1J4C1_9CLOT|nr:ABC transporter substrate-binding protein [Clostridium uliginosum]SFC43479.1 iron(III) transport system substrate-binding protein [Clostridium uliginosum]